ncbi:MAG: hypothetical protein ACLP8X_19435 [Streptosporangiaceae bacterium]
MAPPRRRIAFGQPMRGAVTGRVTPGCVRQAGPDRPHPARPWRPGETEAERRDCAHASPGKFRAMKKILELLVCFLHPIAVVLIWIDLATRREMAGGGKLAWAIFSIIPLVPFLYVLTGGDLW